MTFDALPVWVQILGYVLLLPGSVLLIVVVAVVGDIINEYTRRVWLRIVGLRHPQPLARWARMALAHMDRGGLWLDESPEIAQMLLSRDWGIHGAADWARECKVLLSHPAPMSAWDGLRAIRITMMAACIGWITEQRAWDLTAIIAPELAWYGDFSSLARAYTDAYVAWLVAQRADPDDEVARRRAMIEYLDGRRWDGVPFTLASPSRKTPMQGIDGAVHELDLLARA